MQEIFSRGHNARSGGVTYQARHIMTRYLTKAGIYTGDQKPAARFADESLQLNLVAEDVPYYVVHKILGHQKSPLL